MLTLLWRLVACGRQISYRELRRYLKKPPFQKLDLGDPIFDKLWNQSNLCLVQLPVLYL